MKLVILESPYAGDVETNVAYARRALRHSLSLGEAPIASHLLYTQVLDDSVLDDRFIGINAGHAWMTMAEAVVAYIDHGISKGMMYGLERAQKLNIPIEYRSIN